MMWRWVPPAHSPTSPLALLRGALSAPGFVASSESGVIDVLSAAFGTSPIALTDSGTTALTLALRATVSPGKPVALPAYSCVDLITAAQGANVAVRLYDVDPATLSPDLDSLREAVGRGVAAIVVAPLFGYPVDMDGVSAIATAAGVPVIEDAAQSAGATFRDKRIGSFGALTVLSFSRGKGTTGGSGGALLVRDPAFVERARELTSGMAPGGAGWSDVVKLGAQWMLGRPSLFRIPSSVPALRLGEMVYHPPHAPRGMSRAAHTMLRTALALDDAEIAIRRVRAREIGAILGETHARTLVAPVAGGVAGYLRLAVRDVTGIASPCPDAGILRGYPITLDQHEMSQTVLVNGEVAGPGAGELRDRLFTLPVHSRMNANDVRRVASWVAAAHR